MPRPSLRSPHRLGLCLAVLAGFWALPAEGQETAASSQVDQLAPRIDELAQDLLDRERTVGLVVGLIRDGETWVRGYGRKSLDGPDPPDGDTIYEITHVTKLFTQLLVFDAELQGWLDMEDELFWHLPEELALPTLGGEPIRIRHLWQERSGLPRNPPTETRGVDPYLAYDEEELKRHLAETELRFVPGAKNETNDWGYGLLGYALARIWESDFESLMRDRVLDPLNMKDSGWTLTDAQRQRLAPSYDVLRRAKPVKDFGILNGAGGMLSTANDMLRFAQGVFDLKPESLERVYRRAYITTRFSDAGPEEDWTSVARGAVIARAGRSHGYKSWFRMMPGEGLALIVLANTNASDIDVLAKEVFSLMEAP